MSAEVVTASQGSRERELQLEYDLTTQFAEFVDGFMRTDFELYFNGYDLIAEDGRSLEEATRSGLEQAKDIVKTKPNLWFEVRRRSIEQDEKDELLQMAGGEGPNTKVVVSDFPAELMDATEDVGGYNVRRKQAMLRVLVRLDNGNIQMYSQTLDGSNRTALDAIYDHLGQSASEGELLGQRISIDVSPDKQDKLVEELTSVYDLSLESQFGGQWFAGRQQLDHRNTYNFVCAQQDLIGECIRLDGLGELNRNVMYNMAATMNKRFLEHHQGITNISSLRSATEQQMIQHEIEFAGSEARSRGLTFSACGVTLGMSDQLKDSGYGNKTDNETKYAFNKKMHCVVCQSKVKEGEAKKMCGPCGICRACDRKMGGKG